MSDRFQAGIPSQYITSQLGRLSLASLCKVIIETPVIMSMFVLHVEVFGRISQSKLFFS